MSPQPAHVTATSPLKVTVDGSSTAVPAMVLGSYTPVDGDEVAVVPFRAGLLVLGKVS